MLDSKEKALVMEYWQDVGGTLVWDYPLIQPTATNASHRTDAIILVDGFKKILDHKEVDITDKQVIAISVRNSRLDMGLMGRAFFIEKLFSTKNVKSLQSVAICTEDDAILNTFFQRYPRMELVVIKKELKFESFSQDLKIYRSASEKYIPDLINVLFISESPPDYNDEKDRSFFYFEDNPMEKDFFFIALIKAIYDIDFKSVNDKRNILGIFKSDGYYMMDIIDYPINKSSLRKEYSDAKKEDILFGESEVFLEKLNILRDEGRMTKDTKIVLIKKSVFSVFCPLLRSKGYRVLNTEKIDTPSSADDRDFIEAIRKILDIQMVFHF